VFGILPAEINNLLQISAFTLLLVGTKLH